MSVLSDDDIMEGLMTGYLGISNFDEAGLTPNGYDLRVSEVKLAGSDDVVRKGVATIPPRTLFYVSTVERVRLPEDLTAQLWMRTTWIRRGIMATFGKVDAGFRGTLTVGAYNASDKPVELPIGERFCQIVFETMAGSAVRGYAERSGNYQGQEGITLDPKG
ncbi:MAG: dCTP deaminase [Thermoplasmatales archaeon]|nr:dCTP deaminase [Thermoplasmatales archaeon]